MLEIKIGISQLVCVWPSRPCLKINRSMFWWAEVCSGAGNNLSYLLVQEAEKRSAECYLYPDKQWGREREGERNESQMGLKTLYKLDIMLSTEVHNRSVNYALICHYNNIKICLFKMCLETTFFIHSAAVQLYLKGRTRMNHAPSSNPLQTQHSEQRNN